MKEPKPQDKEAKSNNEKSLSDRASEYKHNVQKGVLAIVHDGYELLRDINRAYTPKQEFELEFKEDIESYLGWIATMAYVACEESIFQTTKDRSDFDETYADFNEEIKKYERNVYSNPRTTDSDLEQVLDQYAGKMRAGIESMDSSLREAKAIIEQYMALDESDRENIKEKYFALGIAQNTILFPVKVLQKFRDVARIYNGCKKEITQLTQEEIAEIERTAEKFKRATNYSG